MTAAFESLLSFALALTLFYLVGAASPYFVPEPFPRESARIFFRILIGMLICVFALAALATHLKTVFITYPVFFAALYFLAKPAGGREAHYVEEPSKALGAIAATSTLVFLFAYVTGGGQERGLTYHLDDYYYAQEGLSLVESGVENSKAFLLEFHLGPPLGPNPYHYLDLWLQGLAGLLTRGAEISPVQTLVFVTHSLLWTITLLALAALIDETSQGALRGWRVWASAFLCLAVTGISLGSFAELPFSVPLLYSNLSSTKLCVPTIFLCGASVLHLRGHSASALVLVLMLAVTSASAWPAAIGGVFLLSFWLAREPGGRRKYGMLLLLALFCGLAQLSFYDLLGDEPHAELSLSPWALCVTVVKALLVLLPTSVAALVMVAQSGRPPARHAALLVALAVVLVCGCFGWALTYHIVDATQVFTNMASPVSSVLLVWACSRLACRATGSGMLLAGVIILVGWGQGTLGALQPPAARFVSSEFLQKIRQMSGDGITPIKIGVLWKPTTCNSWSGYTNHHAMSRANFLLYDPRVRLVALCDTEVSLSEQNSVRRDQLRSLIQQPFYRYRMGQQTLGRPTSTADIIGFARLQGVSFFLHRSDEPIPPGLDGHFSQTTHDPDSRWSFSRLRQLK